VWVLTAIFHSLCGPQQVFPFLLFVGPKAGDCLSNSGGLAGRFPQTFNGWDLHDKTKTNGLAVFLFCGRVDSYWFQGGVVALFHVLDKVPLFLAGHDGTLSVSPRGGCVVPTVVLNQVRGLVFCGLVGWVCPGGFVPRSFLGGQVSGRLFPHTIILGRLWVFFVGVFT